MEDSEDDTYFFNRTFVKSGLAGRVHHSANGAIAVEFLENALASGVEALPSIIFLDLKMPVLNGFDVLQWMRQRKVLSELPVVVLSGSEQQDDKEKARQLGAKDYLVKPVRTADLVRLLKDACPQAGNVVSCEGRT